MINITILPDEIKYLILGYLRLENTYNFDVDSVFSSIEPLIFMSGEDLCINICVWYGTKKSEDYNNEGILHTIFDRPYPMSLERSFGNFSKILYKNIKKFRVRDPITDKNGNVYFAGTYSPLREGIEKSLYFNKLSHVHFCYKTKDICGYFRELGILDSLNLNENKIINLIKKLKNKFISVAKESIIEYSKTTNNYVNKIILKKIKNKEYIHDKLYFSICKNIPDYQKLLELKILEKI